MEPNKSRANTGSIPVPPTNEKSRSGGARQQPANKTGAHQLTASQSALLALALSGCAGNYLNSYDWRVAKNGTPSEVTIRIDRRSDAGAACSGAYHANLVACADNQIAGGLCVITIAPDARADLLAHEALHCFGYRHK